jgi:UDP-N-acetylglucosamine diphosphorylase / glucose-1-phosphate thymidylyltransferase / UDP-N-acetylgalactosamine diphosphorylase / glucosamine-1-phosphate N-acetyltransferase / galactosamine-1-phosphate N-acetyltransferase
MFTSIHLFDDPAILQQLRPLTDHKSLSDLFIGTSSIADKWKKHCHRIGENADLHIIGCLLPSPEIIQTLESLIPGETLYYQETPIAYFTNQKEKSRKSIQQLDIILHPEDLLNFQLSYLPKEITPNSFDLPTLRALGNIILSPENCYIHPSAQIKGSIIDASLGPVHIAEQANIQIGTLIQGPVYIGQHSITNLGAKIRPYTSIGNHCKVGGEISMSLIHDYTNKAHDGYLGNSIIGSFCNFGALSNSSNVKNDLKNVQIFDYSLKGFRQTACRSIGLICGDFITTGVGSQFNTSTVLGSHSNITCHEFPERYIPSFSWGKAPNFEKFTVEKAIATAATWSKSKNNELAEKTILRMHEIWKEL